MQHRLVVLVSALLTAAPLSAAGGPDYETLGKIRDEGFRRSQVMETARHLTDVIGPRLTGSAQMKAANDWTREQLAAWGLANAHLESYEFGEGWSFTRAEVRMTAPSSAVLAALPKAWTPGTDGPRRGEVMEAKLEKPEDVEALKGKLAGKILLVAETPERKKPEDPVFRRHDAAALDKLALYDIPEERDREAWRERSRKRRELWQKVNELLAAEGALATIEVSSFEHGLVRVGGGGGQGLTDGSPGVPGLVMAVEPYERLRRLIDAGETVEVEIEVEARFERDSTLAWNTLAELPGSDKSGEVVMAGAHLDSWHAGTGATDNAAGSAVVMEALRILKAVGAKPRRTIRVGLWSGEEQGLLGSRAYVEEHFASRPEPTDEAELALPKRYRKPTWPIQAKPEHAKLTAYFNLDNGGGRVRGIYAQENLGAKMLFADWIEPLADLGVAIVTMDNTGGTDHQSFDGVGLPGFQFVQDPRDYGTRSHHSNIDTYERLDREDLMQASVVMATFLYNAANLEGPFPRKPMPQEPAKAKEKKGEKPAAEEAAAVTPPAAAKAE